MSPTTYASMTTKGKYPRLESGDGYFEWSEQMRFILMEKGRKVWQVTNGTLARPTQAEGSTAKAQEKHATDCDAWDDANDTALALIGRCLSPSLLYIIRGKILARECWDVLRSQFQERLEQRVDALEEELSELRQGKSAGSFDAFVSKIEDLCAKLSAVGVTISPARKTRTLLKGVRKELTPWVASVQVQLNAQTLVVTKSEQGISDAGIPDYSTFDAAVRMLRDADSTLAKQEPKVGGPTSALVSSAGGKKAAVRKETRNCFKCGAQGHLKVNCPQLGKARSGMPYL